MRILRYYRFQARFGSTLDEAGEEACAALAPMLKGLSRERVAMELLALLALPDPHATLARMLDRGVLPVVLPEVAAEGLGRLADLMAAEKEHGASPDPIRRLAAMLPADGRTAEQVAARLRLSNAHKKRLARLEPRARRPGNPHVLAYREGIDVARDLLLLAGLPIAALDGWTMPAFPLRGGEIVARGVDAGPEVARIMHAVEDRWLAEGFPDGARVQQLLDEELAR